MPMIPMTEAKLREAMRDRRYWNAGHPERNAYATWVTATWQHVASQDGGGDGVVRVRAYERHGNDGKVHLVQAHTRAATARAWEAQPNPERRAQIARSETGRDAGDFGYGMRGQAGTTALGRYQLNRITLQEAGWRDARGDWTTRAAAMGIRTDDYFLRTPVAQEAALGDALRAYERQLRWAGASDLIGSTVRGLGGTPVPVTMGGLVAAAHREGAPTVRRYIAHRLEGRATPPSVAGRGDLSRFNQIEERQRAFAATPYVSSER